MYAPTFLRCRVYSLIGSPLSTCDLLRSIEKKSFSFFAFVCGGVRWCVPPGAGRFVGENDDFCGGAPPGNYLMGQL